MKKRFLISLSFVIMSYVVVLANNSGKLSPDSISARIKVMNDNITEKSNLLSVEKQKDNGYVDHKKEIALLEKEIKEPSKAVSEIKSRIISIAKTVGVSNAEAFLFTKSTLLKQCVLYSVTKQRLYDICEAVVMNNINSLTSEEEYNFVKRLAPKLNECNEMCEHLIELLENYKFDVLELAEWKKQDAEGLKQFEERVLKQSFYYTNYYLNGQKKYIPLIGDQIQQLINLKENGFVDKKGYENVIKSLTANLISYNDIFDLYENFEAEKSKFAQSIAEKKQNLKILQDLEDKHQQNLKNQVNSDDVLYDAEKDHDEFVYDKCIRQPLRAKCDSLYIKSIIPIVEGEQMRLKQYIEAKEKMLPLLKEYVTYYEEFRGFVLDKAKVISSVENGWQGLTDEIMQKIKKDLGIKCRYFDIYNKQKNQTNASSIKYLDSLFDEYLRVLEKKSPGFKSSYDAFLNKLDIKKKKKVEKSEVDAPASQNGQL